MDSLMPSVLPPNKTGGFPPADHAMSGRSPIALHCQNNPCSCTNILSVLRKDIATAQQLIEKLSIQNREIQRQLNEAQQREENAKKDAYCDELTGLPNRRLLKDRFQQEVAYMTRARKQAGLLLIDLDDFKEINDTLGHATGDQLLCEVANRLAHCIRVSDTVCRYGGDEFVIIMSEIDDERALEIIINKIRLCMETPYFICDREIQVGSSIGRAVFSADGAIFQEIIKKADADMYKVKALRKRDKDYRLTMA